MKLKMNITSLQDLGDCIKIKAQGNAKSDAEWQPYRNLECELPTSRGKRLNIGDDITVTVERG